MKVTAIIPDELIVEAMELSKADTITETVKIALIAYIRTQKIKQLGATVLNDPLAFRYAAKEIRDLNRE